MWTSNQLILLTGIPAPQQPYHHHHHPLMYTGRPEGERRTYIKFVLHAEVVLDFDLSQSQI